MFNAPCQRRPLTQKTRHGRCVDAVLEDWDALWGFCARCKVRKLRFRAFVDTQRALYREVDRLYTSPPGDNEMLLLYGNAASSTNIFGRTKSNVKSPAKTLFDAAVRRKKAVCMWADEFRTYKLDVYDHPVHCPLETHAEHMRPPACQAERHAMDTPSWRCFCVHHSRCAEKRTVSRRCTENKNTKHQFQYDAYYHNHGQKHGHRAWNRDVLGVLNIGCLFLAQSLELDLGFWKRGTVATTSPLSWAEIFGYAGHALPISFPLALPPNGS